MLNRVKSALCLHALMIGCLTYNNVGGADCNHQQIKNIAAEDGLDMRSAVNVSVC